MTPPIARILVVDDEPVVQDVLHRLLDRAGYAVRATATAAEALVAAAQDDPDLIVLDVMLPDGNGLELLREFRRQAPDRPVIMMTAYGSVADAVAAMKQGAFHYLTKPFANDEVTLLVDKALDTRRLRQENRMLRSLLEGEGAFEGIVGRSPAIREVFRLIEQLAPSRSTVLIAGESGTGKELVARAIHRRSPRAAGPFVSVNVAGIPPELMEATLFGHLRGAFTGATSSREGLFRAAEGGTLFLDEIGALRLDLQAKLLRVMQERSFMPVGSTDSVSVDVRVLAATNVDLRLLVERGQFREDLFYRLDVLRLLLPPLRERGDDAALLAAHFARRYAVEHGKTLEDLEPAALRALTAHPWPGNVRELENAMIRAVVLATGPRLRVEDLPLDVRVDAAGSGPETGPRAPLPLAEALATYERNLIRQALRETGGVQRQAAARLGLRPTTLHEKMKRLGVREGGGLAGRAQQGPPSPLVSGATSPDNDAGKEVGRADVAADPTADVA